MQTFELISIFAGILFFINSCHVHSLPAGYDAVTVQPEIQLDEVLDTKDQNVNSTIADLSVSSNNETGTTPVADLETAGSEQNEQTLVSPLDSIETGGNTAAASNLDPTIYGGLLTPEAFQQYMNHFGAAYPYAAAPYPAPVYPGFVPPPPPIYPSPYVVETGYEGFLLPSTTTLATTTASSDTSTTASTTTALMNPFMALGNIISTIMMSTLFRIVASIGSAIGMMFFGGAILDFFCNNTPFCDMSYKAITYLRRHGTAERMGRMISEEMTPERVRRTAEFVRNAISKYHELQQLMEDKNYNNTMTNNMGK